MNYLSIVARYVPIIMEHLSTIAGCALIIMGYLSTVAGDSPRTMGNLFIVMGLVFIFVEYLFNAARYRMQQPSLGVSIIF
jgi:hypothetical protein